MKKVLMFACILLLAGMISTASAITIGNAIVDRGSIDGATNIAFIDPTLVFPTDGTLESFSFNDLIACQEPGLKKAVIVGPSGVSISLKVCLSEQPGSFHLR